MDIVVADAVTKNYRTGVGRARVREMTPPPFDRGLAKAFPNWWYKGTFNALEDVSISVSSGSAVGLVGHNGAGKTTLLKVLAGVTSPTRGKVQVNGRVAALIDALVGFHPELTGAENILMLGSMHGFGRRHMRTKVSQISDFSGIEDMLETPVKRYSAGMSARLGFATIAALEPEILLVDEVLAVGDSNFQRKCIQWLDGYREDGGTLLFVSHNLSLMRNMTQQCVWLDHGKAVLEGPTSKVLAEYARAMEERMSSDHTGGDTRRAAKRLMRSTGMNRWGAGGARVKKVHVGELDEQEGLEIVIDYEATQVERATFCVGFIDEAGREIGAAVSRSVVLHQGGGTVRCDIGKLGFKTGIYFPIIAILSAEGTIHDRWRLDRAVVVDHEQEIIPDEFGSVEIPSSWDDEQYPAEPVAQLRSAE